MNKSKSVEEWKSIIEAARSSGLTDKEWCLANGVSIKETLIKAFPLRQIAARSAFLCDLCAWFLWGYD